MRTSFDNLKKSLEKAILYPKDIKEAKKKFDAEKLETLETKITDLITDIIDASEEEAIQGVCEDKSSPRRRNPIKGDVEGYVE